MGSASGRQGGQEEPFNINIQAPNPKIQEARKMWQGALRLLNSQFQGLLDAAEAAGERTHWQDALERLGDKGELR